VQRRLFERGFNVTKPNIKVLKPFLAPGQRKWQERIPLVNIL